MQGSGNGASRLHRLIEDMGAVKEAISHAERSRRETREEMRAQAKRSERAVVDMSDRFERLREDLVQSNRTMAEALHEFGKKLEVHSQIGEQHRVRFEERLQDVEAGVKDYRRNKVRAVTLFGLLGFIGTTAMTFGGTLSGWIERLTGSGGGGT